MKFFVTDKQLTDIKRQVADELYRRRDDEERYQRIMQRLDELTMRMNRLEGKIYGMAVPVDGEVNRSEN